MALYLTQCMVQNYINIWFIYNFCVLIEFLFNDHVSVIKVVLTSLQKTDKKKNHIVSYTNRATTTAFTQRYHYKSKRLTMLRQMAFSVGTRHSVSAIQKEFMIGKFSMKVCPFPVPVPVTASGQ